MTATHSSPTPVPPRGRFARRWDPDARGGLRLTLAAVAALLVAVPFALLLALVTNGWGPLRRLDLRVAGSLHTTALGHPGLVSAMKATSDIASPTTFRVLAVVVAILLAARRRPRLAIWLLVAIEGGGVLDTLVKDAVGRARPTFATPVATAYSTSFPSGHALGIVVGVGALLLVGLPSVRRSLRLPLVLLGVLLVLAVGGSRIGLGVHYVSDVLGGYVLGVAWLTATVAGFRAWRQEQGKDAAGGRPLVDGLAPAVPEAPLSANA